MKDSENQLIITPPRYQSQQFLTPSQKSSSDKTLGILDIKVKDRNTVVSIAQTAVRYRQNILMVLWYPFAIYCDSLGLSPQMFQEVSFQSILDNCVILCKQVGQMWKVIDTIDVEQVLSGRPEPTFSNPWDGELTENITKQSTDLPNARHQFYTKAMGYQLELDMLSLFHLQRIMIIFASMVVISKLTSYDTSFILTTGEAVIMIILPVATNQVIKAKRIQLALNMFQTTMILLAWSVVVKEIDSKLSSAELHLGIQAFLHAWSEFFLNPLCRVYFIAMKFFNIENSTILTHTQVLLITLVLRRMPLCYAGLFVAHMLVNIARNYYTAQLIMKLIDQKLEEINPSQGDQQEKQPRGNKLISQIVMDLAGPLDGVQLSMVQLQQQLPLDPAFDQFRAALNDRALSCAFLSNMVNNILSHTQVNEAPINFKSECLENIMTSTISLFNPRLDQKNQKIKVYREPSNDQFPYMYKLDAFHTSQILINLLSHSINSDRQNDIEIRVYWVPTSQTQPESCSLVPWLTSTSSTTTIKPIEWREQTSRSSGLTLQSSLTDPMPSSNYGSLDSSCNTESVSNSGKFPSEESKRFQSEIQDPLPLGSSVDDQSVQVSSCLDFDEDNHSQERGNTPKRDDFPFDNSFKPKLEDVVKAKQLEQVQEQEDDDEDDSICDFAENEEIIHNSMNLDHNQKMDQIERKFMLVDKDQYPNYIRMNQEKQPHNATMKRVFIDTEDGSKVVIEYKHTNEVKKFQSIEVAPEVTVYDNLPELEAISEPAPTPDQVLSVEVPPVEFTPVMATPTEEPVPEVPIKCLTVEIPVIPEQEKVVVSMGETGSNCFDECESKDLVLTPVKEERQYVESEISIVQDNHHNAGGRRVSPPDSMASLLDQLGENQSNTSWISDSVVDQKEKQEAEDQEAKANEEQQNLFGSFKKPFIAANEKLLSVPQDKRPVINLRKRSSKANIYIDKIEGEAAPIQPESTIDALKRFRQDSIAGNIGLMQYHKRRQSFCPAIGSKEKDLMYTHKTIKVRHPLRARSKSITLPNFNQRESKNFPISRLNNYDQTLKKHRGSIVSMQSSLQSIDEAQEDDGSPKAIKEKGQPYRKTSFKDSKAQFRIDMSKNKKISKPPIVVNSIQNFGHGRRNNLVKIADQISQRARASSVIITDLEVHQRKLLQVTDIESCDANSVTSSVHNSIHQAQQIAPPRVKSVFGTSSSDQINNVNLSSSNSSKEQMSSVFKSSYSFTAEVAKATILAKNQKPFERRRVAPQPSIQQKFSTQSINSNFSFKNSSPQPKSSNNLNQNTLSFASSEDGWDDGALIIELVERGTDQTEESPKTLQNKFQTSFDLVSYMSGELIIDSKMISLKIPTLGKMITHEAPQAQSPENKQVQSISRCLLQTREFTNVQVLFALVDDSLAKEISFLHKKVNIKIGLFNFNFQPEPDTSYLVYFDPKSANYDSLVQIKQKYPQYIVLIQVMSDQSKIAQLVDLTVEYRRLSLDVALIIKTVCGRESQSSKNINQLVDNLPTIEVSPKSPYMSKFKISRMKEDPTPKSETGSSNGPPNVSITSPQVSLSPQVLKSKKQMILDKVNTIATTQDRFTQVKQVPIDAGVILVVDSDQKVRDEVQHLLMNQIKHHLISYINRKLEVPFFGQVISDDLILKKVSSPSLFIVEATSGEQAIDNFKQLLLQKCKVHLILMNCHVIAGDTTIDGVVTANEIKSLERDHNASSQSSQKTIMVGYGSSVDRKVSDEAFDAYKSKPLDLMSSKKLIRALIGKDKQNMSKRDRIIRAFTKAK